MSSGLVFAQFGLLASLVWQVYVQWPQLQISESAIGLIAVAIVLGAWAFSANRFGNFNVIPEPRDGGKLVTHGPYRWIRHPMYVSVWVFAVGCAVLLQHWWAWFSCGCLLIVLWFKSSVEERLLAAAFPQYANYIKRTKRFVPGLF